MDAAQAYVAMRGCQVWAARCILIFVLVFAVAAHFHSIIAEVAAYAVPLFSFYLQFIRLPRARREFCSKASTSLGVKVSPRNFPPRSFDRYVEWCRKNGLAPPRVPEEADGPLR